MAIKFKIKTGDKVVVTKGKDKGLKADVLSVDYDKKRVKVKGVALAKVHTKPTQQSSGGIVSKEASIAIANVAILDPKNDVATKVGYKFLDDGKKVRFAKNSGEVIDQ